MTSCSAVHFSIHGAWRCWCWTKQTDCWTWGSGSSWMPSWRACLVSAALVRLAQWEDMQIGGEINSGVHSDLENTDTDKRGHNITTSYCLCFRAWRCGGVYLPIQLLHYHGCRYTTAVSGLFSATQTEAVEALARAGLRNPVKVNVAVTLTGSGASPEETAVQKTPSTLQLLVRADC